MHITEDLCKTAIIFGLLSVQLFAQDTLNCYPPCRSGYVCHNGECISRCNPLCPSGQECNQNGDCITLENAGNQKSTHAIRSQSPRHINRDISCNKTFIVRPDMNPQIIPGDYEESELLIAANMIANAIICGMPSTSTTIISNDEVDIVKHCKSNMVIAKVKSYHKEPARMGQYQGVVSITIDFYNSVGDKRPSRIEEFEAKGGRHWGDSVPLENAFQAVSTKIKLNHRRSVRR